MTTELTLTIDDDVIHSAGEYARTTGKSLSGIVENYLKSITAAQRKYQQLLPEVSQLMGVISCRTIMNIGIGLAIHWRKNIIKGIETHFIVGIPEKPGEMTEIADVTAGVIHRSFKAGFRDYEDAVQYCCAISIPDIDLIVTRNTRDFKKSSLPVFTPPEAIALLEN